MSKRHVAVSRPVSSAPGSDVLPVISSPSLATGERPFFEGRLGEDFSRVRLHTDEGAAALGANALTRGNDIAFARDRYRPGTPAGRRLLAHELVHVAQQKRSGGGTHTGVKPS